ncbi:MAG: cytidine deaminase [Acidobacteriaceae bacterium]
MSSEYPDRMIGLKKIDDAMRERLRGMALEAAQHAYAPYSGFRVGAALQLDNGRIVTGCNVENASYGLTICAERSAMVQAVAQYGPGTRLQAVCIVNLNNAASSPCGACRQFMAEFAASDTPVYFPEEHGETMQTIAALLPFGFAMNSD